MLRVDSVDELQIQLGANVGTPYLHVSGVDMNGENVGPLRLWNHDESDVEIGNICILRGLRVATERQWNGEKYVTEREGPKRLDCDNRTAIENVSDQPEITHYFEGY